ncbi:hypothetical protein BDK51DRAFT_41509 [Blyttiomyces helicus]|uniref:Uncharacterized protein n=1 Tax=Blyttiomyces helicus TaxID=388810 RepID=A0A4P9WJN6_9FUNG|nr:hypothetical protein BDK51DRAFT_41509 [Blyttiomyces helicus]|eukprot:RKO92592.1 hypothetical protein BDK51DRAFT_41509 [Blyttiomyces helicus]
MESPVIKVPKHLLARLLYANPVCLLTTVARADDSSYRRNVMTISWLTPIDNDVRILFPWFGGPPSSNDCGFESMFVLNVPVQGMEDLIVSIGGCTGREVGDKFDHLQIPSCSPGWADQAWPPSDPTPIPPQAPSSPRSRRPRPPTAPPRPATIAIGTGCVAHLVCRIEERQQRRGHSVFFSKIEEGFVRASYWDGRNFAGRGEADAPYLSFLGTKRFASVNPLPAADLHLQPLRIMLVQLPDGFKRGVVHELPLGCSVAQLRFALPSDSRPHPRVEPSAAHRGRWRENHTSLDRTNVLAVVLDFDASLMSRSAHSLTAVVALIPLASPSTSPPSARRKSCTPPSQRTTTA